MISKIDHIAIAVENLEQAIALYENTLGLKLAHRESVPGQQVETATFPIGDTAIELVQGKGEDSPISRYIQNKGPGIHHIAFAVEDIEKAIAELKGRGARLVDETPRPGKEGSLIAFIHPKSAEKILYEIVQPSRKR